MNAKQIIDIITRAPKQVEAAMRDKSRYIVDAMLLDNKALFRALVFDFRAHQQLIRCMTLYI